MLPRDVCGKAGERSHRPERTLRLDLSHQVNGARRLREAAIRLYRHGELLHPWKFVKILDQHAALLSGIQAEDPGADRFVVDRPELIDLAVR